jgi:hypothetical protein
MTNGGIIEGFASEDKPRSLPKANSDLSPVTSFPNGSMRVFHGAGTTEEENKAGRWTNIPDGDYPFGGSGASSLQAVSLRKPAIEKEARLRPQHFFTFGSGDCSFANASEGFKGWGADEVAPPRS